MCCSLLRTRLTSRLTLTEAWFLLYWKEENCVTSHKESELVFKGAKVCNDFCEVLFGAKLHTGMIAATGQLLVNLLIAHVILH